MKLNPNQFVYEIVIHGERPSLGGGIRGGHVIIGTEVFDDDGNFVRVDNSGGLPLESLAGDTIDDKLASLIQPVVAAQAADLAKRDADVQAANDAAAASLTALSEAHSETLAARDATIEQMQGLIDALGGTEVGQKLAVEKRRAEAERQKADAEALLAALPEAVAVEEVKR